MKKSKEKSISQKNRLYLKKLRENATLAEKIVRSFLIENNIRFIFQRGFFKPFHRIVDFYIPRDKLVIEIDGSSHYGKEEKDNRRDNWFIKERKIRIMRFTNEEVFNEDYKFYLDSVIKGL